MTFKTPSSNLTSSDITPEEVYKERRRFMLGGAALVLAGFSGVTKAAGSNILIPAINEPLTDVHAATHHNNYYEFSTDKKAVSHLAKDLVTRPWNVSVEGEVLQAKTYTIDELQGLVSAEERIYRFRCVEGWSMVLPWVGIPLSEVIKRANPTESAKFVEFVGASKPETMIGQRRPTLPWPYTEGLRMDEAMHPLAFLVFGMYGKPLPNQNGAPLRLIIPWKYGFKSIKAITKIRLVSSQPVSSWTRAAPSEYGFYANVNPAVAHPRWNQRRETRLGEFAKRDTLPFNGYAEQVAHLYRGMDLTVNF